MAGAVIGWTAVGALALVGIAAGYTGMRRYVSSASRVIGVQESAQLATFLGGALTVATTAGSPLARLDLFAWGVRLSASAGLLRYLLPTWEARYDELQVVRSVTAGGSHGVRLAVADDADAVVFWSSQWPDILDRFAAAGVAVDRSPIPLKTIGGVRRAR